MNNNLKKKTSTQTRTGVKFKVTKKVPVQDVARQKLLSKWQGAISDLRSQIFHSRESAVNKLVDSVISEMRLPQETKSATKDFLITVIETHPEFLAQIERSLKIEAIN